MPIERAWRLALTLALVTACDKGRHEAPAPPAPVPPPSQPQATTCNLAPIALNVGLSPKRLVAIGDLHGDLEAARAALKAVGVIDDNDHWIGKDTVLVQTGDILDRGDGESQIIDLLAKLAVEAKAAGGAVVQLLGNHELMNAAHDWRYVTRGGMQDFGGDRAKAVLPGGTYAKRFAAHNVVAIVGDTVFSHAGVLPDWVSVLDKTNLDTRCWLDGQTQEPSPALTSDNSPVWTRAWGRPDEVDCAMLDSVLTKLGVKRMVVGHTPQDQGINSSCDGKLWRIDVGLSSAYGGPIQALEVLPEPRVLSGTR